MKKNIIILSIFVIIIAGIIFVVATLSPQNSNSIKNMTPAKKSVANINKKVKKAVKLSIPDSQTFLSDGSKYKIFSITIENKKFYPENIVLKKGDVVKINAKAVGKKYDIVSPGMQLNAIVDANKGVSIAFTANKIGEFPYLCRRYCPKGDSLRGMFVVIP